MHHHCTYVKKDLKREVSVTDRIQTVQRWCIKPKLFCSDLAVDRVWCTSQSCTSDRRKVVTLIRAHKTLIVTFKHTRVRHHMVTKVDRLGMLKVRHTRKQCLCILFGYINKGLDILQKQLSDQKRVSLYIHPEVKRNLVVAASGCM